MNDLPKGWSRCGLADLVGRKGLLADGDWVESKDQDPNGKIRLLQLADIGDGKFLNKSARFINEETFERLRCTEVLEGDVLIARMPDPLGRACVVPKLPQRAVTVVDVAIVRPESPEISKSWLMRFLNAPNVREIIEREASGTTRRRIARSKLAQLELPVPPPEEQKRISDKLGRLLAAVDTCKARLDVIPAILKRFRQSVLAAATSGKLTEGWRSRMGYSGAWKTSSLKDLCSRVSVGHVGETSKYYTTLEEGGIPFLRSQNVRPGRVSLEGLNYITTEFHEKLKKSQLQAGDLLVVRVGANRGDACVLPDGFEAINCANIVFARPNSIVPQYLNIFVQSPKCRDDLLGRSVGGAQGVINTRSVEQIQIDVPPEQEQVEIARRVQELFAQADRIEAECDSCRARIERLGRSLLAKAFRGELDQGDEVSAAGRSRVTTGYRSSDVMLCGQNEAL